MKQFIFKSSSTSQKNGKTYVTLHNPRTISNGVFQANPAKLGNFTPGQSVMVDFDLESDGFRHNPIILEIKPA